MRGRALEVCLDYLVHSSFGNMLRGRRRGRGGGGREEIQWEIAQLIVDSIEKLSLQEKADSEYSIRRKSPTHNIWRISSLGWSPTKYSFWNLEAYMEPEEDVLRLWIYF